MRPYREKFLRSSEREIRVPRDKRSSRNPEEVSDFFRDYPERGNRCSLRRREANCVGTYGPKRKIRKTGTNEEFDPGSD